MTRNLCRNLLILSVLLVVGMMSSAGAFYYRSGDEVYLSGDFSEDVLLAGGTLKFEGTIWGDLAAAGRTVTFDGIVDGNINAAAFRATINGELCRSLRVAANTININSRIDGDVVAFGSEVTVASESYTAGDLAVFGSEALIDGEIGSDAVIRAANITIGGRVNGNLKCQGGRISLAPGALILGDFEYESKEKARISPEAQVHGETRWKKTTEERKAVGLGGWVPYPSSWIWSLVYLAGSLILGAIIILSRREGVMRTNHEIRKNGAVAAVLGAGVVVFTPLILVLTAITIVGIPAATTGLALYAVFFLVGKIIAGISLGALLIGLMRREGRISLGWSLVLGMILLALLFKIPLLGWFLYFLAWSVGTGAILLVVFRRRSNAATEPTPNSGS